MDPPPRGRAAALAGVLLQRPVLRIPGVGGQDCAIMDGPQLRALIALLIPRTDTSMGSRCHTFRAKLTILVAFFRAAYYIFEGPERDS